MMTRVILEPYIGKTLGHMLSQMRLREDKEYAAAADEFYQLLRAANQTVITVNLNGVQNRNRICKARQGGPARLL